MNKSRYSAVLLAALMSGPFWGDDVDVDTIERFEAHAEIVMRRGPIPAGEERAFDARKVMEDLGPTIERPKPRSE